MLKIKTSEDASYRGATIAKVKRAMDSAMKKAGFSFVRENGFGERRFQKNDREVAYVLQGQSGDPSHIDRIVVTKFNPMERSGFDAFGQEGSAVEKAVAWFDGASESLNKGNAMKTENKKSEAYKGIDNFIEGLVDACKEYRKPSSSDNVPDELIGLFPGDWTQHDDDWTSMVALSIKHRGESSRALDSVKGISPETYAEIISSENQAFLEALINDTQSNYGITPYVFGRSGGWIGFKWTDFYDKYVSCSLKDDEATRKAIFEVVWDKYVDEDDDSFTGDETLEELINKLDINDSSEGAYVFDDQDWFDLAFYEDGVELMVSISEAIDAQEHYMQSQEWLNDISDAYDLGAAGVGESESKRSEGLPPKRLGSKRQYRSRADLINKMKQLGAVEITTSKQFNDIKNSQWLHTAGYALDTNGNLVAQSYYGDKDGKWYYTSTRNFDSDYLPESKQHENRTKEEEVTRIFKGMKEWADRWSNSDKDRKNIADNLDLEAVQENMSDIVEILDNNFEWDGYGFKFVVVGDYEDDDTRDEADANQWNRCYGVCEEIADLIGIPDEGHAIGEMNIYFWEEIEADWRDDDSKQNEAARDYIPKADNGYYDVHVSVYDVGGKLLFKSDYTGRTSTTYRNEVKTALGYYNDDRASALKRNPENADEWTEPYRVVILTAPDGENTQRVYDTKLNWLKDEDWRKIGNSPAESKKSESLSLKQKELKDMVRYGEAEDITTISDAEAKELRKKGIELVGVSRGTYGMNGALLRDNEGKKYAITARSSNLFYFV